MQMPVNAFKQALRNGRPQIGLWVGLADSYVAELLATTGFDWLLIDAEHAPNDSRSVLRQLQAIAPYPVQAIVRPVHGSVELIKQYLDLGVQTVLVPMVETAEQAALMVAATRYPTRGIRGVGSALARSSRWNQIDGYLHHSDEQMCVLVQVESAAALKDLEAIAAVPGVDGVFFGPADLSASMGLIGKPTDPAVQAAIAGGIATVLKAGKAAGCLSSDNRIARDYLAQGATFVAVGVDTSLLVKAASQLAAVFKGQRNAKGEPNAKGGRPAVPSKPDPSY
jgi:4-hydroxy-2-oxoheptanedioate aldolase